MIFTKKMFYLNVFFFFFSNLYYSIFPSGQAAEEGTLREGIKLDSFFSIASSSFLFVLLPRNLRLLVISIWKHFKTGLFFPLWLAPRFIVGMVIFRSAIAARFVCYTPAAASANYFCLYFFFEREREIDAQQPAKSRKKNNNRKKQNKKTKNTNCN